MYGTGYSQADTKAVRRRSAATAAVVMAGWIIFAIDVLMLTFWVIVGVYVVCTDSTLMTEHMLAAFHFPSTIGVCLALEAFGAIGRRTPEEAASAGSEYGYLASWGLTFYTALMTDMLSLVSLVRHVEDRTDWKLELAVAIWAMVDSILIIMWSVWLLIRSRSVRRKTR
ncbi:MAG: hypothetical protein WC732_09130 [Candidatus Omnitrophota bacterium]